MFVGPRGDAAMNRRLSNRVATQPRRGLDHDEAAIYVGVAVGFDAMVPGARSLELTR
jgi:hypothetical protein